MAVYLQMVVVCSRVKSSFIERALPCEFNKFYFNQRSVTQKQFIKIPNLPVLPSCAKNLLSTYCVQLL